MLPNCGACQQAGVECTQEDRHRQTLKPRGWTDQLEAQIDKCALLLSKFIPGFQLEHLDYYLNTNEGLQPSYAVPPPPPLGLSGTAVPQQNNNPIPAAAAAVEHKPSIVHDYALAPPYTASHRGPGGVPHSTGHAATAADDTTHPTTYPTPDSAPYSEHIAQAAASSSSTPSGARPSYELASPQRASVVVDKSSPGLMSTSSTSSAKKPAKKDSSAESAMLTDDKGRDPHGNDMSGFAGLVRGFGVGKVYAKGVKPGTQRRRNFIFTLFFVIKRRPSLPFIILPVSPSPVHCFLPCIQSIHILMFLARILHF